MLAKLFERLGEAVTGFVRGVRKARKAAEAPPVAVSLEGMERDQAEQLERARKMGGSR